MKKVNKVKVLILSVIMIVSSFIVVSASETKQQNNLEKMTIRELNSVFYNITDCYINHTKGNLPFELMTEEASKNIKDFTENNDINGEIRNTIVEFTYPDNSSTGDTVIMVNSKIKYEGYDKIYLFEYHINADGKIYGFNTWVY